ncbi:MAG: zinc ribbon domain-containing protein [Caldilineaceae bacterium]|nr:zinc ribbon domain-containing protein [Caldilineaceae bacterium]MCB9158392.1 zinc ribbon domain-containing protein [Caldilineaceae bacterium]
MPMYEYMCVTCGGTYEKLLPMSKADDAQSCPKCGSDKSRRQLSSFSFGGGSSSSSAVSAAPVSRPFT